MDSQDKTLEQGVEEVKQVEETVEAQEPVVETAEEAKEQPQVEAAEEPKTEEVEEPKVEVAEEPKVEVADEPVAEAEEPIAIAEEPKAEVPEAEPAKVYETKQEVIERLKEIAHSEETPAKNEVELLKTTFYKLHFAEREAQQKAYIEAGGDPATYQVLPDADEEVFKAEMGIIKEKRQKAFQEQEAEKQENLQKKLDIIEKIKAMITSPEEANKAYQTFKALQQQWKEIKAVPAEKANELWRNYQLYVEQFYDLLRLNSIARDEDFKKNLEAKTKLCEIAEKLAEEKDVISAFHQLQDLHQQYREIGPVAKELREDIWNRFKAASTVINKRHQQHFEGLRAQEEENLTKKTELCEKAEAIAAAERQGSADWDKHTKELIAIQQEWKTIGFAPQKMNVKIFERFRAACDDFFGKKSEYFKQMKERFAENAAKKQKLVEQAQALADSTEWRSTSDKLIALQREWKTIGMVPKKLGDQLWNDFLAACNKFFEARNKATAGTRNEERDNLEKKKSIIEQLKALAEEAGENLQEKVQQLTDEFNQIGHVPYKEKDNIFKEYRAILDKLYKELNVKTARRRLDNFKSNLKNVAERGANALDNERTRLMRRYEQLKQEINTYENNIGFLNAASKKGNTLIDEMNRKVQKLKDDLELTKQKIKAIDAENAE